MYCNGHVVLGTVTRVLGVTDNQPIQYLTGMRMCSSLKQCHICLQTLQSRITIVLLIAFFIASITVNEIITSHMHSVSSDKRRK